MCVPGHVCVQVNWASEAVRSTGARNLAFAFESIRNWDPSYIGMQVCVCLFCYSKCVRVCVFK